MTPPLARCSPAPSGPARPGRPTRALVAVLAACGLSILALVAESAESSNVDNRRSGRGYRYQHDSDPDMPWSIHVVRIRRGHSELRLQTTSGGTNGLGMGLVSIQARSAADDAGQPVAAINGDFYTNEDNYPGRPRDLQIRRGEVLTDPDGHTCFWIDPTGNPRMTNVLSRFRVVWPDGTESPIGLNEERVSAAVVLYSAATGTSTRTRGGTDLVLDPAPDAPPLPLRPGLRYPMVVRTVVRGDAPLTSTNLVLSVGPRLSGKARRIAAGARLTVILETSPDLTGVETAIGGGPALIVEDRVMEWSGLNLRHPRTAVGWSDEEIFFVEVDGRQRDLSVGMSFPELAAYMRKLGCRNAMNLDGGGSATVWVLGNVINSPSEGRERPAANALVLTERRTAPLRSTDPNDETHRPTQPHGTTVGLPHPLEARPDAPRSESEPPSTREAIASPPGPGDAVFAQGSFAEIALTLSAENLERLRASPRDAVDAGFESRLFVGLDARPTAARLDASVRLKGSAGSFRPVDDKPSWTVDFGKRAEGARWDGLQRVYLQNAVEDPSYLHEALGADIFRAHGIPAPRIAHARVSLNGRSLGLYVLKEAFTEQFLARNFGRGDGELYDNDHGPDLDHPLHRNLPKPSAAGGAPDAADLRLRQLADAVGDPNPEARWRRLSASLDTERFLTFAALEVLVGHRDGYGLARNNFRLYRDPNSDRWVFLPDGMDQLFGLATFPWRPRMSGLAARALLESEEGRRLYTRRFLQLLDTVFRAPTPATRVDALADALRPRLTARERDAFDREVADLRRRISDREHDLRLQVAADTGGAQP